MPSWSLPPRTRATYCPVAGSTIGPVVKVEADGTHLYNVSQHPGTDAAPSWSR